MTADALTPAQGLRESARNGVYLSRECGDEWMLGGEVGGVLLAGGALLSKGQAAWRAQSTATTSRPATPEHRAQGARARRRAAEDRHGPAGMGSVLTGAREGLQAGWGGGVVLLAVGWRTNQCRVAGAVGC